MNRTFFFRIASLFLLFALLFPLCLAGCNGKEEVREETDAYGATLLHPDADNAFSVEDLSSALIVYPENADASLADTAKALQAAISEKFGVRVNVMVDYYRAFTPEKSIRAHEILIGATNRPESASFLSSIRYDDYGFSLIDGKLAVLGGTDALTAKAVDALIARLKADDSCFWHASADAVYRAETKYQMPDMQIGAKPVSAYRIVYGGNSGEMLWGEACRLRDAIAQRSGHVLPILSDTLVGALGLGENFDAIVVGAAFGAASEAMRSVGMGESSYILTQTDDVTQLAFLGDTFFTVRLAVDAFLAQAPDAVTAGTLNRVRDASYYEATMPVCDRAYPVGEITVGGVPLSDWRIVYSAADYSTSAKAAAELAFYLQAACGVSLPIVTDDAEPSQHEIVVGITNRDTDAIRKARAALERDGYLWKYENDRLYLTSHSEDGMLISVYFFLDAEIGVRFYGAEAGDEHILIADRIDIPTDLEISYIPFYRYRSQDWVTIVDFQLKLGANNHGACICPKPGGDFEAWIGVPQTDQPCLTDEETYQRLLQRVREVLRTNTNHMVEILQNDNFIPCQCENCRALAEQENDSGVQLLMINRLSDDLTPEFPDLQIVTFAYEFTRKPPKTVVARDNVIIWLCNIECCFVHDIDDPDCELNAEFMEEFHEWKNHAKNFFLWDYTTNYASENTPFPDFESIYRNASVFTDLNAMGIFYEGPVNKSNGIAVNGEFFALRTYLLERLAWDPFMSREEYDALTDEFLRDYYGAGWKYVRYFMDLTHAIVSANHLKCFDFVVNDYMGGSGLPYEYLLTIWDRALSLAETEEEILHCRRGAIQVKACMTDVLNDLSLLREMRELGIGYVMQNVPVPNV